MWEEMLVKENISPRFVEFMKQIIPKYSKIEIFDDGFRLHKLNLTDYILIKFPQYALRIHEYCIFQSQGSVKKEMINILNSCIKLRRIISSVDFLSKVNLFESDKTYFSIFNSRFDYIVSTDEEDKVYASDYHGRHDPFADPFVHTDRFSKVKAYRAWDYKQGSEKANAILTQLRKAFLKEEISDTDRNDLLKRIQIDILLSEAHKDKTGKCGDFFVHSLHRRLLAMEEYLKAEVNKNRAKRGRSADPYTARFLVDLHDAFCREFNTSQMNKDFFALVRMLLNSLHRSLKENYQDNLKVSLANKQDSSIRRMINSQKEKDRKLRESITLASSDNKSNIGKEPERPDWLQPTPHF